MIKKFDFLSPVPNRDFVWFAEKQDKSMYSEYDIETREQNDFEKIDKSKTTKFGIFGHGHVFCFHTVGGDFVLNGRKITFGYKVDDIYYDFNNMFYNFTDFIMYRSAYSDYDPSLAMRNTSNPVIYKYNFGYKTSFKIHDTKFNFKVICHVPMNEPVYLEIWLVANRKLDGDLLILKNEGIIDQVHAPLEEGVGGTYNWIVQ